jgi:hypothetical protein
MHTIEPPVDNVLWVKVNGTLSKEEYADLVPSWEAMMAKHGKLRLLFQMEPGFTGWGPVAAWDDMEFSVSHRNEFEKVAVVGAKQWHEYVASFGKLMVDCQVRYFTEDELAEAQAWLRE